MVALIFAAIMNLFFSGTILEGPLVLGTPLLIIGILYFGKKGKPENFLVHLIRFYLDPGFYSAACDLSHSHQRKKIYG
ncbi:MAG: hypothetical protein R3B45_16345 [Bdellovibrionota bacterium]